MEYCTMYVQTSPSTSRQNCHKGSVIYTNDNKAHTHTHTHTHMYTQFVVMSIFSYDVIVLSTLTTNVVGIIIHKLVNNYNCGFEA